MPNSGDPHPDFPGCLWSTALSNYVCDDGYTVDGQPLPLPIGMDDGAYQPNVRITRGGENVTVSPLGEVTGEQLSSLIKSSGGHIDLPTGDPLVAFARSEWWKY